MEEVLRELTEFELDAVAGGNPFSQQNVFGSNTQNTWEWRGFFRNNAQFFRAEWTFFFGSSVSFGNG